MASYSFLCGHKSGIRIQAHVQFPCCKFLCHLPNRLLTFKRRNDVRSWLDTANMGLYGPTGGWRVRCGVFARPDISFLSSKREVETRRRASTHGNSRSVRGEAPHGEPVPWSDHQSGPWVAALPPLPLSHQPHFFRTLFLFILKQIRFLFFEMVPINLRCFDSDKPWSCAGTGRMDYHICASWCCCCGTFHRLLERIHFFPFLFQFLQLGLETFFMIDSL